MEEELENPEDIEQPEDMETIVSGTDKTVIDDDFSSLDEDLDSLREKSTRTSDVYDILKEDDEISVFFRKNLSFMNVFL